MKDAIAINDMEPDSNFFLANLLSAKGNLTGAMHHYKQSVQMKPDYAAALQFILVRKTIWSSLSTPSMDYVGHGEIQGRYFAFFKAHDPVFYHVVHSPSCRSW